MITLMGKRGKQRTRRRRTREELRLAKLQAKAHALGGELHPVWTDRQGMLRPRYLEPPPEDVRALYDMRWAWRYAPHASDAIFDTPHQAFANLVRFITQRGKQ